jgi:hypothetical protein
MAKLHELLGHPTINRVGVVFILVVMHNEEGVI